MARISVLCLAIIAGTFASVTATDYCNIQSCKKGTVHTMCKYTSPTPARACVQWSNQGFSDTEINEVLRTHNDMRRRVASGQENRGKNGPQPAAVSMPDLIWDNELAAIAQRWANQCNYGHSACDDVKRFSVGQNIAKSSASGMDPSSAVQMIQKWYNEVDHFDRNLISSYGDDPDGDIIGHYTQIVWADTKTVGCGQITWVEGDWIYHYLVCDYGPAGNVLGRRIYEAKN